MNVNEFFGTPDVQPGTIDPMTGVRIVPAGVDTSVNIYDPVPGVRDARTPEQWHPLERILADQLGVPTDSLRLIRAYQMDLGSVTTWEHLAPDGSILDYPIAVFAAGVNRVRISYAKTLSAAEGRAAVARAELADKEGTR